MTDRRQFIKKIALGTAASSVAALSKATEKPFSYPFILGVASGDVTNDSVVLWTRLAPDPLSDNGGMNITTAHVQWKLATSSDMTKVVQKGDYTTSKDYAHSVHIDVDKLVPNTEYWYQFYIGTYASPVGRTKTLPSAQDNVGGIRFVTASCQNFTHGHFVAYKYIVADKPDFVLHLGDYIYDKSYGYTVRKHDSEDDPTTLVDFRRRHALYKTDSFLRAAHATLPFYTIPDNHDAIYDDNPEKYAIREAAYQAWFEHMPVRGYSNKHKNRFALHREISIGNLLRISLLDTRQFRDTEKLCPENTIPDYGFGIFQSLCEGHFDSSRTMLGEKQEKWLTESLQTDTSYWHSIASTGPFSPFRFNIENENKKNEIRNYIGGWDAYSENRQRIVNAIPPEKLARIVVVSGDIHSFWAFDGTGTEQNGDSIPLVEFVTSSITSDWPEPLSQPMQDNLSHNPHAALYRPEYRGYMLHRVSPQKWITTARAVRDVTDINSGAFDLASFELNIDNPGLRQI